MNLKTETLNKNKIINRNISKQTKTKTKQGIQEQWVSNSLIHITDNQERGEKDREREQGKRNIRRKTG